MVTTEQIKALREKTGISIAQCKKALEESVGDMAKALESLKKQGAAIAEKKSDRELGAGVVRAYIHSNASLGALVAIHTETDFVAKNDELRSFADDVAMQVVAGNPTDLAELLSQPFIKDSSKTIEDLVKEQIQKFGERVEISKFSRFNIATD